MLGKELIGAVIERARAIGAHDLLLASAIPRYLWPGVDTANTRAGMLPDDDPVEWRMGETRLHNTGSWVYEPHFIGGRGAQAPHWPGCAIEVGADGDPALHRLLTDVPEAELRPARARA